MLSAVVVIGALRVNSVARVVLLIDEHVSVTSLAGIITNSLKKYQTFWPGH